MKSLKFYLNHLQEQGICSIDGSLDFSYIDELVFRKIINYPTIISQMISGIYAWPSRSPSRKSSSEGTTSASEFESNSSNCSHLNSDSPSLASTREESDFFLFNPQGFFLVIKKTVTFNLPSRPLYIRRLFNLLII